MKKYRYIFLALSILLVLFIWSNSAKSADVSSEQSGGLANAFIRLMSAFHITLSKDNAQHFMRKAAHFFEYSVLGCLLSITFGSFGRKLKSYGAHILLLGVLIAIIDEFIQLHIPGRSGELTDVMLDFSGVSFGLMVFVVITFINRKRRQNS